TLMVRTYPTQANRGLEWVRAAHSSKTNRVVTGCWLRAEHCLLHRHGRKPVVAVGHGAVDHPEELLLDRTRDRSESAFANANLVHRADRSDLRRAAGKKDLVGQVKHFAGDHLLDDRDIQVARDLDNGIARDSRQNRVAQGGGHEHALADDKQVLARALADVAVGVKRNAFGVAVEDGLHLDELSSCSLRRSWPWRARCWGQYASRRRRIRPHPLPGCPGTCPRGNWRCRHRWANSAGLPRLHRIRGARWAGRSTAIRRCS